MNPSVQPSGTGTPSGVHHWRRRVQPAWFALGLLLVWTLFWYRETAIGMATIWARSETFTHGFLVLPIVSWLVWRQRKALAAQIPQPNLWWLLPLAGAALFWLLGELAVVNAVTQLSLAVLLVLCVPVVLGTSIARRMIFPLGFLFFAVPMGEFLMPQLMDWTANFTVLALRLSGIPVYREGLQFVIPSGNWSVVEACSGVRYLVASFMVGTLFAYLNYRSMTRRLIFVAVSIVVPIVANWARAYMIVMLGHLSGNKLAAGVDHLIYGWLFFGVVIMLMFIVGARWAESASADQEPGGILRQPATRDPRTVMPAALAVALMVALPHGVQWLIGRADGANAPRLVAPAVLAAGWQAKDQPMANFKPAFHNPSAEINTGYAGQAGAVGMYLGYYRNQDTRSKLVSSANVLVTSMDPHWVQVAGATRTTSLGGQHVAVRAAELRSAHSLDKTGENRLLVWQIYWINGTLTANDYLAKVYSALYRLTGQGDDAAVVILYTPKDGTGHAEALLESFLSANYMAIDELLNTARAGR